MAGPYDKDEEKANKLIREGLKKHGDGRIPVTKKDFEKGTKKDTKKDKDK